MSFTAVSGRECTWLLDPGHRNNQNEKMGPGTYDKPIINDKLEILKQRLEDHRRKTKWAFGSTEQNRNMSHHTIAYTPGPGFYGKDKSIDVDSLPRDDIYKEHYYEMRNGVIQRKSQQFAAGKGVPRLRDMVKDVNQHW